MKSFDELRLNWHGETAWVVGSGSTLGYVKPRFFHGKRVISVNHSAQVHGFTPSFVFSHYHSIIRDALMPLSLGVTMRHDTITGYEWVEPPINVVLFDTPYRSPAGPDWDPFARPDGDLLYGSTSLHGAMHLACHLGAASVILVGADCGWVDGHDRIPGYPHGENPPESVLGIFERHNRRMKQWLQERYDVDIHSLNPFINLNLEGHDFRGAS